MGQNPQGLAQSGSTRFEIVCTTLMDSVTKTRAWDATTGKVYVFDDIFQGVRAQEFEIGSGWIGDVIRCKFDSSFGWDNG